MVGVLVLASGCAGGGRASVDSAVHLGALGGARLLSVEPSLGAGVRFSRCGLGISGRFKRLGGLSCSRGCVPERSRRRRPRR